MERNTLIILINKEIDNELSPVEKKMLLEEINTNPDSKKLYEELKTTSDLLREDSNEYELDITEEVLSKIDSEKYNSKSSKSWLEVFYSVFSLRFPIAYSLGVLSGIAVLGLLYISGLLNISESGLSGTMSSPDVYGSFKKADEIIINQDYVNGTISSQFQADMVITDFQLTSSENFRIDLRPDDSKVSIYSIKPIDIKNDDNFTFGTNFINVNNKSESKFLIIFKSNYNGEDIRFRFTSESGQQNEYTLATKN